MQQSAGGEGRNADKSQSHSFRSLLYTSSFQRAVCAKLPCGGQPSIWRRIEAWSRSPPDPRRDRARCVSVDGPGLASLDGRENICRWSGLWITCVADYGWIPLGWILRTRGNLLIRYNDKSGLSSVRIVFFFLKRKKRKKEVKLDFERCAGCFTWMVPGDVRLQV